MAAISPPLIDVQNLGHGYRMAGEMMTVLSDISFQVRHGEFVAIIGPSGSGKSTLMNMLGCLDVANEGTYLLDGQDIRKLSDNKLATIRNEKIGFIFQQFNLLPKLTAYENVELPLIYRNVPHKERKNQSKSRSVSLVWKTGCTIVLPSCQAGSSSGWPSPVQSPAPRRSCSRTNRPARWTARPASK